MVNDSQQEELDFFAETLESLLEDMPLKPKEKTEEIIKSLRTSPDVERLIKIQDELETVSVMQNIDYFTRNEIMNVITSIENIINGN